MKTHILGFLGHYPQGESAPHPIELGQNCLAALLRLAGIEPASLSRLASQPCRSPLERGQLRFLG